MAVPKFHSADSLEGIDSWYLAGLHEMAEGGSSLAAAAALFYCCQKKISVPPWVVSAASAGYCNALRLDLPKKRGRSSGPVARYNQDLIDFGRHDEVLHLREKQQESAEEIKALQSDAQASKHMNDAEKNLLWLGSSVLRAYECASMLLSHTPAFGGPEAMRASYNRVKRNNLERPQSHRYHMFDPDFLSSIGIVHPSQWGAGRKYVHFYTLTL
jgi:hypothetical protein